MAALTTNIFIDRAKVIHGDKYDYSLVNYVGIYNKVRIICKIHGEFFQKPAIHLNGNGCKLCGYITAQHKIRITNQKLYNVDYPLQSKEIQQKTRVSCFNSTGVDYPLQSKEIQQKADISRFDRYGSINYLSSEIGISHRSESMNTKYNTVHALQVPEFKSKLIHTNQERFNRDYAHQQHISIDNLNNLNNTQWLSYNHIEMKYTLGSIADKLNTTTPTISKHFDKLNIEKLRFSNSQGERDILEFLSNYNIIVKINTRNIIPPLELDIFLPDHNIAIEYNGLYWHSELSGIDKNYHLNKTRLCQERGIRLIHIFENEWILQPDIVKSRLLSLIHQNSTIYARKCKIVTLTNKQSTEFFNQTHIQGSANASVIYGLMYNNELVAAMSFGRSRFNKQIEWELIRYSNKLNCSVVGGASRLFNHFIKNHAPNSIISYSDKRWNTGGLYLKLGFKYSHSSNPNYFYFNAPLQLLSRQQFQKHKLKDKLEIFDPTLTEWQNMINNRYNRIWDCGNDVFIYNA